MLEHLKSILENANEETDKMFDDTNVSRAKIIGYLQGTNKHIITVLNDLIKQK